MALDFCSYYMLFFPYENTTKSYTLCSELVARMVFVLFSWNFILYLTDQNESLRFLSQYNRDQIVPREQDAFVISESTFTHIAFSHYIISNSSRYA